MRSGDVAGDAIEPSGDPAPSALADAQRRLLLHARPHLFPQHGPGAKHERPIVLEPWQERIVERYPGRLLRGLIHSDGCRVINRVRHPKRTYAYPRYFFSNRSRDIHGIFCAACDRLGIAWRQDGPWNISVARREAVAGLDRHVGAKR